MWYPRRLFFRRVALDLVPFVVPFESHARVVGADYVRRIAVAGNGAFQRDARDMGLLDDLDVLAGPSFDPSLVHPLIREFYEHTTRFEMSVRPRWHGLAVPVFWVFRKAIAERVRQVNLPFSAGETLEGIESHIDTVDWDYDDVVDVRGWVRTYRNSDLPIYVGIYTTFRDGERGYVSVGFPFPEANLTATLVPSNCAGRDLLLRTDHRGSRYAGDYLVWIDERDDLLTVLRIWSFKETIRVYVDNGELETEHKFSFLGIPFLTLHYSIRRKPRHTTGRAPLRVVSQPRPAAS